VKGVNKFNPESVTIGYDLKYVTIYIGVYH
jgi:hypothetical protein